MNIPSVATLVPDQSDLVCEGCGYALTALARQGNCPECGKPITESIGSIVGRNDHRA
ncbi:hypothetical protein [Fontivita pretiosa]|uniref:hypothetical protein n=1 Tax=Fontivita pretiosa TaxID=2989684 RepID=UPI003D17363A